MGVCVGDVVGVEAAVAVRGLADRTHGTPWFATFLCRSSFVEVCVRGGDQDRSRAGVPGVVDGCVVVRAEVDAVDGVGGVQDVTEFCRHRWLRLFDLERDHHVGEGCEDLGECRDRDRCVDRVAGPCRRGVEAAEFVPGVSIDEPLAVGGRWQFAIVACDDHPV